MPSTQVENWKTAGTCKGHSSYITHLDWSKDSKYLQTNCGAYELLFWNAKGNQEKKGGSNLNDFRQWDTWSCTLGWPVEFIWPPCADGTDINNVDRSHTCIDGDEAKGWVVALGNDSREVRLLKFPQRDDKKKEHPNKTRVYKGHAEHVTSVRWTAEDKYLISIGGADRTTMQWKVNKGK